MIAVDFGKDAGELESVDFEENMEILSDEEQRAKWDWELSNGLIDQADILIQQDPDRFEDRAAAQEYLQERSGIDQEQDNDQNTLLNALQTPVL